MTAGNNTSCLCPNCKTDLNKIRFTQFHVHLYVDNFSTPDLTNHLRDLKSKRKLNKYVLDALIKTKDSPAVDIDLIRKSILRIESLLEITSDKALVKTLGNELNLIKSSFLMDSAAPGAD